MYKHSFEKLIVWQESIELVEIIYKLTKKYPNDESFGLISQIKRAVISISSNIAEGTSRITNKDKAHFTTIAFSSTMEVLSQVIISKKLNFINEKEYLLLREKLHKISNMLNALRKSQLK